MRLLFVLALLLPLAAFADGFAYGEKFMALNETDQSAVIRLEPGGATVDMYIAITGIPRGKTITYILPFWHKPEGFSMEEMDSGTYQQRYVLPAHEQLVDMNELASDGPARATCTACMATGTVLAGPITLTLLSSFAKSREKARQGGVSGALHPYAEVSTSHAHAELFEIGKEDLQALITQAGLPEKYVAPLKKYQTHFFAVMRLTGLGIDPADRKVLLRGIHYHFTHPLTDTSSCDYIYPLGTGAAWPQPINATQVYITCPQEYEIAVDAPTEGINTEIYMLRGWIRDYRRRDEREWTEKQRAEILANFRGVQDIFIDEMTSASQTGGTTAIPKLPKDGLYPATASELAKDVRHTYAWHVAYFHSNPNQDIHVRMTRRPHSWILTVAHWLLLEPVPYLLAVFLLLLACTIAARLVLLPNWVKSNKPCRFFWYSIQAFLRTFIGVTIVTGIFSSGLLFFLLIIGNEVFGETLFALTISLLITLACIFFWRRLTRNAIGLMLRNALATLWVTTIVIYVALSAGFIAFATWACRAAVG